MTEYLGQQQEVSNEENSEPRKCYWRMKQKLLDCRKELVGKEFETEKYGKCKVVEYNGKEDVIVMFYEPVAFIKTHTKHLKSGKVKNTYYPSLYGKGFIGEGQYSSKDGRFYTLWTDMMKRGYDRSFKMKFTTYKDVTVCTEWYNFQNFAEWCDGQQFFNAKDEKGHSYHLDKDILAKGNKIYSPETCCFLPSEINTIMNYNDRRRGSHPVGVYFSKSLKKYCARCSIGGRNTKYLGYFRDPVEAFYVYKQFKESHIKQVAEKWKDKIDDRAYDVLIKHTINITD